MERPICKESDIGLPPFTTMTTIIESRGYEIGKDFVKGGMIAKYRLNKGEWVKGTLIYKDQMVCQKAISTVLYKRISK